MTACLHHSSVLHAPGSAHHTNCIVLKVVLFWPILHVSFTLFFCLVVILYASCYSTFWALFCIPFLAYLYTDFEAAIYCKCSYFWSIFSAVEGNFSVWV